MDHFLVKAFLKIFRNYAINNSLCQNLPFTCKRAIICNLFGMQYWMFDECNATDLLSKMFTDFTGNIRGFSIRTGTLLIIIIILYTVTLLPQDFLTNENEK